MKVVVYNTLRYGTVGYRKTGKEEDWTLDQLLSEIQKANSKSNYYADMAEEGNNIVFTVGDGEDLFFDAEVSIKELLKEISRILDVSYYE